MIVLALSSIALMLALSAGANHLIPLELRRLPMQWSVKGAVHWTAPRAVALLLALSLIGPLVHGLHLLLISRALRGKA